ncbi:MAG: rod shape-determining protein MreD [Phycisphaerales bacterium JB063]
MNWLIFTLFAYLAYILQAGLAPLWTLGTRTEPRLLLILLVYIAMQASPTTVAFAALALGALHDIRQTSVQGLLGPWTLGYLAAGYVLLQLRNLLFRDSVFTIAIMAVVAGIFAYLVSTALYALRGVSFLLSQPVAEFSAANAMFQGFFDLLYTAVIAMPIGYLLIKSHSIWDFQGANFHGVSRAR